MDEVVGKIQFFFSYSLEIFSFSRRKQLAPRSRLVRQCELCDFSSSIISEFKNHMTFEHEQNEVFLCDTCRYYSLSPDDFHLHVKSHHDSMK